MQNDPNQNHITLFDILGFLFPIMGISFAAGITKNSNDPTYLVIIPALVSIILCTCVLVVSYVFYWRIEQRIQHKPNTTQDRILIGFKFASYALLLVLGALSFSLSHTLLQTTLASIR